MRRAQRSLIAPGLRIPGRLLRHAWLQLRGRSRFEALAARSDLPSCDLIVSLTTTPSRLPHLFPALASLLDQTLRPAKIVIALPEHSRREGRSYLVPEALVRAPGVQVLRCGADLGPATKLLPCLQSLRDRPSQAVLAVDDDNIYPPGMIASFDRHARGLPDDALSLRGWPVPESGRWSESREFTGAGLREPVRTDVITGCGGILVRPRFFDEAVFDIASAPPAAFFTDDLWFSGHLARRRVPRCVIPINEPFIYLPTLAGFHGRGLDQGENRDGSNNDAMLAYFKNDWIAGRSA